MEPDNPGQVLQPCTAAAATERHERHAGVVDAEACDRVAEQVAVLHRAVRDGEELLELDVLALHEGLDTDPVGALATHVRMGDVVAVHVGGHEVAADAAQREAAGAAPGERREVRQTCAMRFLVTPPSSRRTSRAFMRTLASDRC